MVCIDSDGCAIDSMDGKHRLCFAPLMVETWQMEGHREEAEEIWNKVSLWSVNRGDQPFQRPPDGPGALWGERVSEGGSDGSGPPGMPARKPTPTRPWRRRIGRTGSPLLEKVLEWSISSNAAIAALPPCRVFPGGEGSPGEDEPGRGSGGGLVGKPGIRGDRVEPPRA